MGSGLKSGFSISAYRQAFLWQASKQTDGWVWVVGVAAGKFMFICLYDKFLSVQLLLSVI